MIGWTGKKKMTLDREERKKNATLNSLAEDQTQPNITIFSRAMPIPIDNANTFGHFTCAISLALQA